MAKGYGARTQSYTEYLKDHEYYEKTKQLKGRRMTPKQRAEEIKRMNKYKANHMVNATEDAGGATGSFNKNTQAKTRTERNKELYLKRDNLNYVDEMKARDKANLGKSNSKHLEQYSKNHNTEEIYEETVKISNLSNEEKKAIIDKHKKQKSTRIVMTNPKDAELKDGDIEMFLRDNPNYPANYDESEYDALAEAHAHGRTGVKKQIQTYKTRVLNNLEKIKNMSYTQLYEYDLGRSYTSADEASYVRNLSLYRESGLGKYKQEADRIYRKYKR